MRAQRVVVAPPGVLEPPVANSTAISYPMMQMAHSEPPPANDDGSLSLPLEPAFQVVVKNTFIDIVETPKAASRSRSEPPRAMSKVEKKHRCLSADGDVAELSGEQWPVSDGLSETTTAPAMKVAEPSVTPGQQQFSVSADVLNGSALPTEDAAELPQAQQPTHEQDLSVFDSLSQIAVAPTTKVPEPFVTQGQREFSVYAGILKGSTLPTEDLSVFDNLSEITTAPATEVVESPFTQRQQEFSVPSGIIKGSTPLTEDAVKLLQAKQFTHEQDLSVSDSTVDVTNPKVTELPTGEQSAVFSRFGAFPALIVRNTFIEVYQSLHVPGALRTVKSAAGRLDQLAMEGEAIHQAQC